MYVLIKIEDKTKRLSTHTFDTERELRKHVTAMWAIGGWSLVSINMAPEDARLYG